jgi:pyruvate-formate lyase
MKIQTITYMQRKNLGNYEHAEISASAVITEGEDEADAVIKLMAYVDAALNKEIKAIAAPVEAVVETAPVETAVKEKKTRSKKSKEEGVEATDSFNGQDIPQVITVDEVKYNRDLDTHRQLLSSYLNKSHPTWKTKEGVKEFSSSLVGKSFLDNSGNIIDPFKKVLSDFFA